jgi:hypothetical protein
MQNVIRVSKTGQTILNTEIYQKFGFDKKPKELSYRIVGGLTQIRATYYNSESRKHSHQSKSFGGNEFLKLLA